MKVTLIILTTIFLSLTSKAQVYQPYLSFSDSTYYVQDPLTEAERYLRNNIPVGCIAPNDSLSTINNLWRMSWERRDENERLQKILEEDEIKYQNLVNKYNDLVRQWNARIIAARKLLNSLDKNKKK